MSNYLTKIASPQVMSMYFKECKKHNVSPLLLTKIGTMQKEAFPFLATAILAATLGAAGYDIATTTKEQKQIDELRQQIVAAQKEKNTNEGTSEDFTLDKPIIGGGIVGGGVGAWLGPKLMPKQDETNARLIGGLGGALVGGLAGSYIK